MKYKMPCSCGQEMSLELHDEDKTPEGQYWRPMFWLCEACGNQVDLYPPPASRVSKPPTTYAPEYIDSMSADDLKALCKELTWWALDVHSSVSHWYRTHYEEADEFDDTVRFHATLGLLKPVGLDNLVSQLIPRKWLDRAVKQFMEIKRRQSDDKTGPTER